ncbi:uncharacterized protein OCT59_000437 [Rhizophagus irregularis]|uniref:uncharacterized protein n=1 Tax=Rhizophagus irregularis TaxID=588596 RepID=UPI00331DB028|nr:hypothetical protein OCT59_000437 [Rhizophagus irregularis]
MDKNNDPFDPTSKLKSSPVPVLFIPFNNNEKQCNYCGIKYSETLMFEQKYCKNCLFWYIQYITGNNTYLNKLLSGYQISSGWVESTLTKKSIPILYLPWWDSHNQCAVCDKELKYIHQESKSYCQKWCSCCFTIYTGCRYCLTTNIIFGIADQSQCKKCKRTSFININITNISSGNFIIDKFLDSTRINNKNLQIIAKYLNNRTMHCPIEIYFFIHSELDLSMEVIEWIPYSQIMNLKKIAEGGFSIIYKATWKGSDVAVKKLRDSQNISKHFLNELRSLYQCKGYRVIDCYGITQDPITKEYMLILNYAKGGNLHDYLQKNFINITWRDKLYILQGISFGSYRLNETFEQAENKRLELIQLKKLGPEFSEKSHPKAIYTSRALSGLISKASTIDSMVSFNMKQEYITKEYEFDINNIQSLSTQNTNSATQSLIVPVNSSRKRNFEELKNETNETQKNRKYTKINNSDDE